MTPSFFTVREKTWFCCRRQIDGDPGEIMVRLAAARAVPAACLHQPVIPEDVEPLTLGERPDPAEGYEGRFGWPDMGLHLQFSKAFDRHCVRTRKPCTARDAVPEGVDPLDAPVIEFFAGPHVLDDDVDVEFVPVEEPVEIQPKVRLQAFNRFVEKPICLPGRDGPEGADLVPPDDGAVPADDTVVAIDEVLAVPGLDDVAREVILCLGGEPPSARRRTPLGATDDGQRICVRQRRCLEPGPEVAQCVGGVLLLSADSHGNVEGLVVHAVAVVDDQQAHEPVVITQEAHHNVLGAGCRSSCR